MEQGLTQELPRPVRLPLPPARRTPSPLTTSLTLQPRAPLRGTRKATQARTIWISSSPGCKTSSA